MMQESLSMDGGWAGGWIGADASVHTRMWTGTGVNVQSREGLVHGNKRGHRKAIFPYPAKCWFIITDHP